MADPLLTSLCNICRAAPPKYKCPRCAARTCSLPCSQKHKARTECNGKRNPAKHIPAAQLKTPAGFDHDFNFLRSIELARERTAKALIEERGMFQEQELKPTDGNDDNFEKVWFGDQLHHIPLDPRTKSAAGGKGDQLAMGFERHVRRRIRALNIEALTMPKGMKRERENKTAWNRRTCTINWQVEWMVYGLEGEQPRRILHKALDGQPLNKALVSSLEWQRAFERKRALETEVGDDGEPARKKQFRKKKAAQHDVPPSQDFADSTWAKSEYTMQSSHTGLWDQTSCESATPKVAEDVVFEFAKWQFFLHKAGNPNSLIPVTATEPLLNALTGRTIIEFPTFYVLAPSMPLPQGFVLGSTERRPPPESDSEEEEDQKPVVQRSQGPAPERRLRQGQTRGRGQGLKRGQGPRRGSGRGQHHGMIRTETRSQHDDDAEEGEINSDGEALDATSCVAPGKAEAMIKGEEEERPLDATNGSDLAKAETVIKIEDEDGPPEMESARPSRGLVGYGSDSD